MAARKPAQTYSERDYFDLRFNGMSEDMKSLAVSVSTMATELAEIKRVMVPLDTVANHAERIVKLEGDMRDAKTERRVVAWILATGGATLTFITGIWQSVGDILHMFASNGKISP